MVRDGKDPEDSLATLSGHDIIYYDLTQAFLYHFSARVIIFFKLRHAMTWKKLNYVALCRT